MIKVLGIDPGIAITGWGLISQNSSQELKVLRYGCLLTLAKRPMAERLHSIADQLGTLIRKEKPDAVAIEELFIAKNSKTAASVGHARGVLLYILSQMGMTIFEYNPRQVKVALTGFGAADKPQMQRMVQRLLSLKDIPKPDDAADALAIALCHINTVKMKKVGEGQGQSLNKYAALYQNLLSGSRK